jgi:hypothetical protein
MRFGPFGSRFSYWVSQLLGFAIQTFGTSNLCYL